MSGDALVVVPVLGNLKMTHTLLADVARESHLVDVLIIDNGCDYSRFRSERCFVPGRNIGWLSACNAGLEIGHAEGYAATILLNNDTRLSFGFFAGLLEASRAPSVGLCAPFYDDVWRVQRSGYSGCAAQYQPECVLRDAPFADGTCLLVKREAYERVGQLDAERFGRYGWAADFDYALRVRAAGLRVCVTGMSYLNHYGGTTASSLHPRYSELACEEAMAGMAARYGPDWSDLLGDGEYVRQVYAAARKGTARTGW